ncbi:MAG: 2-dehydropantoate 2-reductase [Spirochaetaceae bacterium]|nr:MAG: 2-dehydropantoate 2-reductase [Spirochaetaceae bacterium]
MKPVQTVYIVGAGALGAAYGSVIHRAHPGSAAFLAEGQRYERLERDGVVVNGEQFRLPTYTVRSAGVADLILLTVKYHHLQEAVEQIGACMAEHTLILSLLNGIDSEEILAEHFGARRVIHGLSLGIDAVRTGNRVSCSSYGVIYFGRPHNDPVAPEVNAIQEFFSACGIKWETPVDMLRTQWWKFMINVGINQASAILDLPYRAFQTNPHARAMMDAAMREVIAVAHARQIELREDDIARWHEILERLSPDGKTSMHQDVQQRRKTEVEMLAGTVIELGKQSGVPTPVNRVLFDLLRAREYDYLDHVGR